MPRTQDDSPAPRPLFSLILIFRAASPLLGPCVLAGGRAHCAPPKCSRPLNKLNVIASLHPSACVPGTLRLCAREPAAVLTKGQGEGPACSSTRVRVFLPAAAAHAMAASPPPTIRDTAVHSPPRVGMYSHTWGSAPASSMLAASALPWPAMMCAVCTLLSHFVRERGYIEPHQGLSTGQLDAGARLGCKLSRAHQQTGKQAGDRTHAARRAGVCQQAHH